jgi:hypothetical protein
MGGERWPDTPIATGTVFKVRTDPKKANFNQTGSLTVKSIWRGTIFLIFADRQQLALGNAFNCSGLF